MSVSQFFLKGSLICPGSRSPHCQLPGLKVRHGVARSGSFRQLPAAIVPPASKIAAEMAAARELGGRKSGGVCDEAGFWGRLLRSKRMKHWDLAKSMMNSFFLLFLGFPSWKFDDQKWR